jgi:hypothetical protein
MRGKEYELTNVEATDTAFLRNPHYHRGSDRSDTLDYGFLASVTRAIHHVVRRIGGA